MPLGQDQSLDLLPAVQRATTTPRMSPANNDKIYHFDNDNDNSDKSHINDDDNDSNKIILIAHVTYQCVLVKILLAQTRSQTES